jgi:hypothetical protein
LHLGLPNGLFPPGVPTKILYAFLLSPTHVTWPTHLTVIDLITWITFSEEHKW